MRSILPEGNTAKQCKCAESLVAAKRRNLREGHYMKETDCVFFLLDSRVQNVEKEQREEWNERSKISDQETQRKQQEEYIAIKEKNIQVKKTNSSAMRRRIRKAKRKKRNMQDCIALYRPYNENTKKKTQ